MVKKLFLYWTTVKNMKPSQIYYRLRKMLKLNCSLGVQPSAMPAWEQLTPTAALPELDFDPVFLARFPVEEFMAGKVTFLHETEEFHWNEKWEYHGRSALWNFNLHYFEFLFPMIEAYRDTEDTKYLAEIKASINGWIEQNPQSTGGSGWVAYTIALRLTNWLGCYTVLKEVLDQDGVFVERMLMSIHEQYAYLSNHLEKDLLANHYFEDLKALVLCALFFHDEKMLRVALKELKKQCKEQILPDGMHFELSPMYHKIILEDVLRVAAALKGAGRADEEIEAYIQPMLDVAYSLEEGLERVPLFNDGGNNVAKSLEALVNASACHFGITPKYQGRLPDSGYYMFQQRDWKLIVDAGRPGPKCNPGHAHCDAMSFELFRAGKPVLVNCGTYAYQCQERAFFRSTAAHNTVMVDSVEQSQCWGAFRMGKASRVKVLAVDENGIEMELTDQHGATVRRVMWMAGTAFSLEDKTDEGTLSSFFHFGGAVVNVAEHTWEVTPVCRVSIDSENVLCEKHPYAVDYGAQSTVSVMKASGDHVSLQMVLY